MVVTLGRRLIETRFSRGHHDAAIHLCKDIRYNLTRVWGALDSTTLEFTVLLSELYTATSQYDKAMKVHNEVLSELVYDDDAADRKEGLEIATKHLELLKRSYARGGCKWSEESSYVELLQSVSKKFGKKLETDHKKWPVKVNDTLGTWVKPKEWGFAITTAKRPKHLSMLKRSSSNWNVGGVDRHNGHSQRHPSGRIYY